MKPTALFISISVLTISWCLSSFAISVKFDMLVSEIPLHSSLKVMLLSSPFSYICGYISPFVSVFSSILSLSNESTKAISEFQSEINSFSFFRTHRCYFVNMKYIIEIEKNVITLTNGERVEISRRNVSNFNKCYMNYLKYSV